jgi:hypothetical protein
MSGILCCMFRDRRFAVVAVSHHGFWVEVYEEKPDHAELRWDGSDFSATIAIQFERRQRDDT